MTDIAELRAQIETIDRDIVDLIATRLEIADELAKAKIECSEVYWDSSREGGVIERYMELCEEVGLSEAEARRIGELILSISKERQRPYFE